MTFAEDGTIRTWELVVGSLAGNEVQEVDKLDIANAETFHNYSFHDEKKKKKVNPVMVLNSLKTYTVEGMEMLEAAEVQQGVVLVAGTMKKKFIVCYRLGTHI